MAEKLNNAEAIDISNQKREEKMIKRVLKCIGYIAVLTASILIVQKLFIRGEYTAPYNATAKIRGFYAEPEDSLDVVFIGASTTYMGVNPSILWREYGIPSYDFCTSEQKTQHAQLYVKEAIRTQHPKVIALDIGGARTDMAYESEAVNLVALNDIPWSLDKLYTILNYTPRAEWCTHIFPLAKYHENMKVYFRNIRPWPTDDYLGYSPYFDDYGKEVELSTTSEMTELTSLNSKVEKALYEIIDACEKADVELVFYATPLPVGKEERQRYNQIWRIAAEHGIPTLDMTTTEWITENDYHTAVDCSNAANHPNWRGATKVTEEMAEFLLENTSVSDRRGETAYADWEEKTEAYYREQQWYQAKDELAKADSIECYLAEVQKLQGTGCITIIMVNDEGSANLSEAADTALRQLGARATLLDQYRSGYLLVNIDGETVFFGMSTEEAVYFGGSALGRAGVSIEACSAGYDSMLLKKEESQIEMNKVAIAGKKRESSRGVNIYVYDYLGEKQIIHACFDTNESSARTRFEVK